MKIYKWGSKDFEVWGFGINSRIYLNPFAFYIEIELLCFAAGFYIYMEKLIIIK